MLKYGGGVLPNTPTEEFENVLFWTFNKSAPIQYAMDFDKSGHFELRWVKSFCESSDGWFLKNKTTLTFMIVLPLAFPIAKIYAIFGVFRHYLWCFVCFAWATLLKKVYIASDQYVKTNQNK